MKTLTPNNLGKTFLVEECQKIKISDFLGKYRNELKEVIIKSELEILELKVDLATSKTCHNGIRFWFKCPLCGRRIGILFKHPLNSAIGCRQCLKLDYRKRRYKGMIEDSGLPQSTESDMM